MGGSPYEHKQIAKELHTFLDEMAKADGVCDAKRLPYGGSSKRLRDKEQQRHATGKERETPRAPHGP